MQSITGPVNYLHRAATAEVPPGLSEPHRSQGPALWMGDVTDALDGSSLETKRSKDPHK